MTKLDILQHTRGRRSDYVGLLRFKDVPHLINTNIDHSMNRDVDEARINDIIQYISDKGENLFFPPVILNSDSGSRIKFDSKHKKIEISSMTKMRVIDGQHRLTAIKTIFTKEQYKQIQQRLQNNLIPFIIIEGLDPEEHRSLFNDINQNAEKVRSVVSERFEASMQNAIGLKFLSLNKHLAKWIEWEKEQSDEKIVYLHLLKVLEFFDKFILRTFNKKKASPVFNEPYHRDDEFYEINENFLNEIFNNLQKWNDDREIQRFYVKRVTLRSITELLIENLKKHVEESEKVFAGQSGKKLSLYVQENLESILPNRYFFSYKGKSTQTKSTYDVIKVYLIVNKYLESIDGINTKNETLFEEIGTDFINTINRNYEKDDFTLDSIITTLNSLEIDKGNLSNSADMSGIEGVDSVNSAEDTGEGVSDAERADSVNVVEDTGEGVSDAEGAGGVNGEEEAADGVDSNKDMEDDITEFIERTIKKLSKHTHSVSLQDIDGNAVEAIVIEHRDQIETGETS